MKYLVTDDSKLARLSLIKSLKAQVGDAEIFQAHNGEEAVSLVKKEKIDIVFLDLTMPVMDGYTALPLMMEDNPKLKVVVVSADIQAQAKSKVIKLGAQLHVQKPINSQKMQDLLAML
ncbi:MAG: two-component system chemotaxis response regulator CheY [Sulfurimonas sp.]|jgi:two-component system chemotaxis response regulator CheY|uniref:response regulator n=1 Tax=Sulfurimonas sp. TaxID=2022749 RepID=UPI0039E566E0